MIAFTQSKTSVTLPITSGNTGLPQPLDQDIIPTSVALFGSLEVCRTNGAIELSLYVIQSEYSKDDLQNVYVFIK